MCITEKRKILCVRQTFASIRDSVFAEFKNTLRNMGLIDLVKIRESNLGIEFPMTGSVIIFKGCDDESKLLSISGITDIWCEEITELSQETFDQLVLRLRDQSVSNHIFCSWNPINKEHWVKKRLVDNDAVLEDGFVLKTTYKDNAYLPDSYIKSLEQMKYDNPMKYRVYALGEWGVSSQLVYENNWEVKEFDILELMKIYPKLQNRYGLDFGFRADETAFIHVLIDIETRQMWVVNELYQKSMLNKDIFEWLVSNGYQYSPIIADSAEQKSIADLKNMGITKIKPARKGKGSINAGIDLLSSYKIYVDPKCENTIAELSSYAYTKDRKTNQYTNKPQDKNNHLLDALRYAMEEFLKGQNKARTISKSVLGL